MMAEPTIQAAAFIFALGGLAGALNALAGGGPIIVVATLAALGWPADVASLTSTVALLPGQVIAGWQGRAGLAGCGTPRRQRRLAGVALAGGAAGALLLLVTPTQLFDRLLPWLVLFATGLYAWSGRTRRPGDPGAGGEATAPNPALFVPLAVYGGFYGGGNSFLVLALLAHARLPPRIAAHAKNILVLLMNAAATAIFLGSGAVAWSVAVPLGLGALAGSAAGVHLIDRLDARMLRWLVIGCGLTLGIALAARG